MLRIVTKYINIVY